jgi:DNA-binding XRE family transcriptional regulator
MRSDLGERVRATRERLVVRHSRAVRRFALSSRQPVPETVASNWHVYDVRSRLAAARRHRGVTQEEMAAAVGLSLATYRRLENGELPNPPLRYLTNCALALDVELTALLEDEWLQWTAFKPRAGELADPSSLWTPPRSGGPALPPP